MPDAPGPLARFYNTPAMKGFFAPTRIIAGSGARCFCLDLFYGCPSIFLLLDHFFDADAVTSELPMEVREKIRRVACVRREPSDCDIDAFFAKYNDGDGILAIGGGSAIDSAKAICARAMWENFRAGDQPANNRRPVLVAIPTTAGTGSETSRYYVLSDKATGEKYACRSWAVCPDAALLDPFFLKESPRNLLVLSAFDAFCHHWETTVCRHEHDPMTAAMSAWAMAEIIGAVARLPEHAPWDGDELIALQRAAALGGVALSNVRTGLIHKLGEGLSGLAQLSHAETLIPFFQPAAVHYAGAVFSRLALLFNHLRPYRPDIIQVEDVPAFWTRQFDRCGILSAIASRLEGLEEKIDVLVAYVQRDHVLFKEHPVALPKEELVEIARRGLSF